VLVRAAARVPEHEVKKAGSGHEEARVRMLAEELHARNVVFLGFVQRSSHLELWERAQAFVVPSVWYENASIAALEAMAQGLPIIASRIGGLPEQVVDGQTRLLVEAQNVDAWEQALRRFRSLSGEAKDRLAQAAQRRSSERFSWRGHLDKVFSAYSEVCG